MKRIIYALQDPRDFVIKYVGMTANPKQRLKEHCNLTSRGNALVKQTWVQELRSLNLKPELVILEDATNDPNPIDREDFYIANYKPVFNKAPAGWSKGNFKITTTREAYSQRSRDEWIKEVRNGRQIEVTYPDGNTLLFPTIQDAADSLGIKRKRIDELLAGYKNKGQGKIIKVLGWRGHSVRYVSCETLVSLPLSKH